MKFLSISLEWSTQMQLETERKINHIQINSNEFMPAIISQQHLRTIVHFLCSRIIKPPGWLI